MTLKLAQTASLLAATLTTGLMAGLFFAFATAVMPGLSRGGDRTYVEGMNRINESILNGVFMLCFLGGLAFTVLALALHLGEDDRDPLPWIVAGLVFYGLVLAITARVNVPLNNEMAAAGTPEDASALAAARQAFESRWEAWNIVRAIVNTVAFGALTWALVLHGRATADGGDEAARPPVAESRAVGSLL